MSPIAVTAEFSENVSGFSNTDVVVWWGTSTWFVSVDGNTYTFNVIPSWDGLITVDVPLNSGEDAVTNGNVASNQLSRTYDTVDPVLLEVTPVPSSTTDTTPDYTFSSSEIWTILYTWDCTSTHTWAIIGNNTVTFWVLSSWVHSNCTISLTDGVNQSNILNLSAFSITVASGWWGWGGSGGWGGGWTDTSNIQWKVVAVDKDVIQETGSWEVIENATWSIETEEEVVDEVVIPSWLETLREAPKVIEEIKEKIISSESWEIFVDTKTSFARIYIEKLVKIGALNTENKEFFPERNITRAEFLKIVFKANGIDYSSMNSNTWIFTDLIPGSWQQKVALKAYELWITSGFEDSTFKPELPITRIQAVKFLLKATNISLLEQWVNPFIDVKESWMKKYVITAKNAWIINWQNSQNGLIFKPYSNLTRAEWAKIIVWALWDSL